MTKNTCILRQHGFECRILHPKMRYLDMNTKSSYCWNFVKTSFLLLVFFFEEGKNPPHLSILKVTCKMEFALEIAKFSSLRPDMFNNTSNLKSQLHFCYTYFLARNTQYCFSIDSNGLAHIASYQSLLSSFSCII